jgi:hypothetical protein
MKGEGKWREIRQKTREFDKRYGKKSELEDYEGTENKAEDEK